MRSDHKLAVWILIILLLMLVSAETTGLIATKIQTDKQITLGANK